MLEKHTPTIVPPGGGEAFWLLGNRLTFKLDSKHSGGAFSLSDNVTSPGVGPPPHVHSREHELFYILEGELELVLDDAWLRAGAGHVQFLPMGVIHTFRNAGSVPARFLTLAAPAGFEQFVAAAGYPVSEVGENPPPPSPADIQRVQEMVGKFGMEFRPEHRPARQTEPRVHDQRLNVLGVDVNVRLTSSQTNGSCSIADLVVQPGSGVPAHAHRREDEIFYVLEGEVEFALGDGPVKASAGATVHVPRGAFHAFRNASDRPARIMDMHTPGGFETFFEEASRLAPNAPMDDIAALLTRHGMIMPG